MTDGTPVGGTSLGRSAARGAASSFAGQLGKFAVQIAGLVVLARLLGPEDYGLLAMVTAIIGVADLLRDFGLSAAALQAKVLTDKQQSNLLWINTAIGALLCVLVIAGSGVIATFYERPEVRNIAIALSATFVLGGFATQFRVRLNRDLRFGALAVTDIAAQVLGLGSAVLAAVRDWGYHALVLQLLVQSVVVVIVVPILARWRPELPSRHQDMAPLLRFGVNVAAARLVGYVSRNVDSILIGARFGSVSLGLYDRAFQMFTSPLNQVQVPATNVALPVLSRLQDDPEKFDEYLLRGQVVLMHVLLFAFAVAGVNAGWLVGTIFGAQWLPAVPYLQVLLVAGCAQVAAYATYWVFLAKSLTGSSLRFELVSRSLLIALVAAGSFVSPLGVACGYAAGCVLSWPMGIWWIARRSDAPAWRMFVSGARSIACYGAAAASALVVPWSRLTDEGAVLFGARTVTVLITCAALAAVVPAFRRDLRGIAEIGVLVRRRRS